jgi:hypothetical protein
MRSSTVIGVPRRLRLSFVLILASLLCGAVASLSLSWSPRSVTEDRNGDGRPDVWRTYDREGRLAEVAIDTNFDGRSDVQEHYEAGILVRRESDRNFDDRVDLVQQFDSTTQDQVRAVEDVDFDGTADLLTLFQSGHAVFSKWARSSAPFGSARAPKSGTERRVSDDPLTDFSDPFEHDLAIRVSPVAGVSGVLGLPTSGWLSTPILVFSDRLLAIATIERSGSRRLAAAILDRHAPRGPPAHT